MNARETGTMLIQRAGPADAQAILDLQKLAYLQEAAIYDDHTIAPLHQTLAEMEDDLRQQVVLKAVVEERIVGSVRATERDGTCFVGRLIVHPEYQNQGIGTRLLAEIEACFPLRSAPLRDAMAGCGATSCSPDIGVRKTCTCTPGRAIARCARGGSTSN